MNLNGKVGKTGLHYRENSFSVVNSEALGRGIRSEVERLKEILNEKSVKRGNFTLASGKTSDFYIDCKPTTLDPEGLTLAAEAFWEKLKQLPRFPKAVGGLATGADPIVAALTALSYRNGGPLLYGFYVRPERKEHGTKKRVEGYQGHPGEPVVIVDDVCTGGNSALQAINQAKEMGWEVVAAISLVDREEGAKENIEEKGCPFYSILKKSELLAVEPGFHKEKTLAAH